MYPTIRFSYFEALAHSPPKLAERPIEQIGVAHNQHREFVGMQASSWLTSCICCEPSR
jgi:hypothetical protein